MKLEREIAWLEELVERFRQAADQPEISDEVRDRFKYDLIVAKAIKGRLNKFATTFKFESYPQFVKLYFEWFKAVAGFEPRMTPAEGKAMKEIIAYLVTQATSKDEAGALKAWKFVLKHWDKLTPFIGAQKSLLQINKNLIEILDQIRNGNYQKDKGNNRRADIEAELRG